MNNNELINTLDDEIQKAKAKISLFIKNLNTNQILYSYEPEKKIISASIIKLPIMLATLELVQKGNLFFSNRIRIKKEDILEDTEVFEYDEREYTLEELLIWMIINSDNTAANCLIDLIKMEQINAYCKKLSLKNTELNRKMLDYDALKLGYNNFTSANDMELIYRSLYNKSILTESLCDFATSILKRQRNKQYSLRYIFDDITVAHKTGDLDYLRHDAGIFYLKGTAYYFGAFVTDAVSDSYAMKWIGRISKLVYEYYKSNSFSNIEREKW